jgi:Na+/H+ antiporter NhaD/arsenite permease-like protein
MMMVAACLAVSRHSIRHLLEAVEWDTLIFFACLFIIVEGLVELGLIRAIGNGLNTIILAAPLHSRLLVANLLFLWVSAFGSAFFESLPYTATIVAVLQNMQFSSAELGIPLSPLAWSLSVGACVGGIGSIMGSSANLVALAVSHRYSPNEAIEGKHFLKYAMRTLPDAPCVLHSQRPRSRLDTGMDCRCWRSSCQSPPSGSMSCSRCWTCQALSKGLSGATSPTSALVRASPAALLSL